MHRIKFVSDEAMPEGHDFVLIQDGERFAIFYRESALCPTMLEDSWAAYRAITEAPPPQGRLRNVS